MEANEVGIEMDNVEEGIVEIVAQHDIRWLVMGAAADEYYTEYAPVVILFKANIFIVTITSRTQIEVGVEVVVLCCIILYRGILENFDLSKCM